MKKFESGSDQRLIPLRQVLSSVYYWAAGKLCETVAGTCAWSLG